MTQKENAGDADRVTDDGVIPQQSAVMVAITGRGDLILEQHDELGNEPETIIIRGENVDLFVAILRRLCGGLPPPDSDMCAARQAEHHRLDAGKDRTAAERQRRFRERTRAARPGNED